MNKFEKAKLEEQAKEEQAMKKAARPRGTDSAKLITVIETKSLLGRGTHDDPIREVTQYWDFDGKLLAENDSANLLNLEYQKGSVCRND